MSTQKGLINNRPTRPILAANNPFVVYLDDAAYWFDHITRTGAVYKRILPSGQAQLLTILLAQYNELMQSSRDKFKEAAELLDELYTRP
jgi:hypothetical protein